MHGVWALKSVRIAVMNLGEKTIITKCCELLSNVVEKVNTKSGTKLNVS
jgi:hypothetical protein